MATKKKAAKKAAKKAGKKSAKKSAKRSPKQSPPAEESGLKNRTIANTLGGRKNGPSVASAPLSSFSFLTENPLTKTTRNAAMRLRRSLLDNGIVFPVRVWKKRNTLTVLKGRNVISTLMDLVTSGAKVPSVPYVVVKIKNEEEAFTVATLLKNQHSKVVKGSMEHFFNEVKNKALASQINIPGFKIGPVRTASDSASKFHVVLPLLEETLHDITAVIEALKTKPEHAKKSEADLILFILEEAAKIVNGEAA